MAGGTPLRLLRLTEVGQRALAELLSGVPAEGAAARLARRLVDAGFARASFAQPSYGLDDLTVVIPTKDRSAELDRLLWRLRPLRCVVVDDASNDPAELDRICSSHGASVVRSEVPLGPGGARNVGAARVSTPLVAFVDSDVTCAAEDLEALLGHFEDPSVAGIAPRICGPKGSTTRATFEHDASPLDMGFAASQVRPGTRVAYVPSACVVLRQELTIELFDSALSVGEDVDAFWRIAAAGWRVLYEPGVTVEHPMRPTWRAWLAQRHSYGRSAASLATKHPVDIAPLRATPWVLAGWVAAVVGAPGLGLGLILGATPALAKRLEPLSDNPRALAVEVTLRQNAEALPIVARQLLRSFAPLLIAGSLVSKRARRGLIGTVVLAGLGRRRSQRSSLDPVRFLALSTLDDLAYCSGLWRGAIERRSGAALRPHVTTND